MATLGDEDDFDSDTSDEDYVPGPGEGEVLSEEEHSGEEEDFIPGDDDTVKPTGKQKKGKGKKKQKQQELTRKRTGGIRLEDDDKTENAQEETTDTYNKDLVEQIEKEKVVRKEDDEKKKSDSLWADFMSDVGSPKTKPKTSSGGLGSLSKPATSPSVSKPKISSSTSASTSSSPAAAAASSSTSSSSSTANPSKVTITKEYDFAGEVVKISKEVDVNSREAKAEKKKQEQLEEQQSKPTAGPTLAGLKRPGGGGGGLGSVLGKIGKKPKMSTLEKSKLDWDSFKQKEGIEEELQIYNRGKAGYLEQKEFLERTDVRQFERERDVRLKLMNSNT